MKKIILLSLSLIIFGCSNDLYKYHDYDNLVYAYGKGKLQDREIKRLSRQYEKIVTQPKGKRKVPAPGVCIDYAYLLYITDKKDKALEMLNKEIILYPESETYVNKLKQELGLWKD